MYGLNSNGGDPYTIIPSGSNVNTQWHEAPFTTQTPQRYPDYAITAGAIFTAINPLGATAIGTEPILNPQTGQFSYLIPSTSTVHPVNKQYLINLQVNSYINGDINAAVFRDYAFALKPFNTNNLPITSGAFGGANTGYKFYVNGAQKLVPTTPNIGTEINALAGDSVNIEVNWTDTVNTFIGDTADKLYGFSKSQMYYSLNNFGMEKTLNDPAPSFGPFAPCLSPPCLATSLSSGCIVRFDNSQPNASPCASYVYTTNNPVVNSTLNTPLNLTMLTTWQTSCKHIRHLRKSGFGGTNNADFQLFSFYYRATDNYCPVPGQASISLQVRLHTIPFVSSPAPRCLSVSPSGEVNFTWTAPDTTGKFGSFIRYIIYVDNVAVDSISNLATTSYTYLFSGPNANDTSHSFYIRTRSGCDGLVIAPALDTLKTMYLNASYITSDSSKVLLTWNRMSVPKIASATYNYRLFRKLAGSSNWGTSIYQTNFVTDSLAGNSPTFSYVDSLALCPQMHQYKVELNDSFPCTSISNIDSIFINCKVLKTDKLLNDVPLSIYPNPTLTGEFTVELKNEATLTITDAAGKVILTKNCKTGKNKVVLNNQTNGFYFLIFKQGDVSKTYKLGIEK